ncbi:MAG: photosystem II reaction center protein PsbN [Actinomycetota bacterium]
MEPATVLSISIGLCLIAITGFSIYTAFGPPSKDLRDPFEEHED